MQEENIVIDDASFAHHSLHLSGALLHASFNLSRIFYLFRWIVREGEYTFNVILLVCTRTGLRWPLSLETLISVVSFDGC
jgi:hypothetical protein